MLKLKQLARQRLFIILIFSLGILMLLFVSFISYKNTQDWVKNREQVLKMRELVLNYEQLLAAIKDAESEQRSYLLTGDSTYLKLYTVALAQTEANLAKVDYGSSEQITQQKALANLHILVKQHLSTLEGAFEAHTNQGRTTASDWIKNNHNQVVIDSLQQAVSLLHGYEKEMLHTSRYSLTQKSRFLVSTEILGSVLSISLIAFAFGLVLQQMNQRKEAMELLELSNKSLELQVKERTDELSMALEELTAGNEEIQANNEELSTTNEQLISLNEELTQTQNKLQLAFTVSRMGSWEWNVQEDKIILSENFEVLQGLSPGEFQHKYENSWNGFRQFIHPDDWQTWNETIQNTIWENTNYRIEYRIIWPDKSVRWMLGQGYGLYDQVGKAIRVIGTAMDITERKQREEALAESEARFRSMADNAPVLIWMSDTDAFCYFFNKTWFDFTGRTLEQEMGNGWSEGVHPDDLPQCLRTYTSSFNARKPFQMEYRLKHVSGEYRHILDVGVPRFTTDGTFIGYIGSGIDIHDRKVAEENLFKSEKLLQSILQNMGEGVIVADKDGHFLLFNKEAERIHGIGKKDISPEEWTRQYNLYLPDKKTPYPIDEVPLHKAIKGESMDGTEFYIKHALTEKGKMLICNARPLIDANNSLMGGILVIRDITERKQAEEQLQKSERLLYEVFENSADALFLIDAQTEVFENYNQQAVQLFGFKDKKELLGKKSEVLQKHPFTEKEIEAIKTELQQKGSWVKDLEYVSRNGREFWGNAAVSLIHVNDRWYYLIRIRDITERIEAQHALENALSIISEDNTRKTRELDEARELQLSMLPQTPPDLPNVEVAMYMKTCTEVGGDYYDYKVDEEGGLTVVVGDATGHGLKAGIVVATVKSYFQTLANECEPLELMERISEGIQNLQIRAMYMGLTIIKYKHDQLTIASSGMPPLYLFKQEHNKIEYISSKGLFLGTTLPSTCQYSCLPFYPGDTLLAMTDGLAELFDKDRSVLDFKRIEARFKQAAPLPAQEVINELNKLGEEWAGKIPNQDDITLVIIKAK